MSLSVEELSASLVREFLSRKGLKMTLAQMDEEHPRNSESISNRVALAKTARIEKLMRKNKELSSPYRTMIEVMVKFFLERSSPSETLGANPSSVPTSRRETSKPAAENPAIPRSAKHGLLTLRGNTAGPTDSGAASHQDDVGKESEIPRKTLKQQRSVSEGVLGKQKPDSPAQSSSHLSRRSSAAAIVAPPVGYDIGGASSRRTHGNPITKTLDADPPGTRQAGRNHFVSEKQEENIVGRGDAIRPPRHPAQQSSSSHRRDAAFLGSRQPAATAVGLGARAPRHHKFKPRDQADLDTSLESEAAGESPAPSRQRVAGGGRLSENRKLLQSERPFVRIPVAELEGEEDGDSFGGSGRVLAGALSSELPQSGKSVRRQPKPTSAVVQVSGELLCEDLEDFDFSFETPPISTGGLHGRVPMSPAGQPITLETAKSLRELLFGSAKAPSFNPEWRRQNLAFCDCSELEYGLVQHKGGPCGVLACIQAYVLKHLLFVDAKKDLTKSPRPSPAERSSALAAGMADILWRAGGRKKATLALPSTSALGALASPSYRPDRLTERLVLYHFSDRQALGRFIHSRLAVFQDESSSGCVLFLYSALLSRGVDSIRQDMDEKEGKLMGAHNYCTQDIVNLLMTGLAVSNVFDGNLDLDSGGSSKHVLKGIPEQSEVGLLSLFEYYGACTVGGHYKEPVLPIWVVCSESHFTVLFNLQRNLLKDRQLEKRFDLHYYDGLANQQEPIRLTIDTTRDSVPDHDDLTPPLELCIRTKWVTATVSWNNTEPLL